jgi:DNA-binding CsgD family transcriptional regulator/tetratricopeptide (TPR) repeat protein
VAPAAIIGRSAELDIVARFYEREPSGARGLLIEGEAGIGKTTVWREAARIAAQRGLVLTSRASEAEARLSFTTLGDLLFAVLDEKLLGRLPAGQRRGLEAALLLGDRHSPKPDQRAVSLAVLGVLRQLARSEPVTIAIDDVQWIDPPSARAISFALRRVEAEPVDVVIARRNGAGSTDPLDLARVLASRIERIELEALDAATLGRVLRTALQRPCPPPLAATIHAQTGGNPFYAIEIARALVTNDAARPGERLPVPGDLEELLGRRVSGLSDAARETCLIVSATPAPSLELLEAAGAPHTALAEAREAGILAQRGVRIEFTHPLLGSTVYRSASARERERIHARLASLADDPEEHARHLALSAAGPSEDIASALVEAARHARDRGASVAAAELLELAARRTPAESALSIRRRRDAAVNLFDAGDAEGARAQLGGLLEGLEPGPERARALFSLSFMSWNDLPRVSGLLSEALAQVGNDRGLHARVLADTAWSEYQACRPHVAADTARAALELAESIGDAFATRHSLSILAAAEAVRGRPARELIERAVALEIASVPGESTGPSIVLGQLHLWAGDVRAARERLEETLARFADEGRMAGTWEIVATLAEVELRAGRWTEAAEHARTALEIVEDAGRSNESARILATLAMLAALGGREDEARALGLDALSTSTRNGDPWNEIAARAALGALERSRNDAAATHAWLAPAVTACERMGLREPAVFPFVPDEIEALVALGEIDEAERLTIRLDEQGEALDRPLALATAARCRGLIAGARRRPDEAVGQLDRALTLHVHVEHPFELARTQLVAGEVQRRLKRKKPARELLEHARATFVELGAPPWAARAQDELARIGGRAPAPDQLTPTESEVARLVAEGRTNREVAQALFISPHTVDANLRRIYRKLRVRSRTELAHRL